MPREIREAHTGSGPGVWGQLELLAQAEFGVARPGGNLAADREQVAERPVVNRRLVTVVRAFKAAAIATSQSSDFPEAARSASFRPSRSSNR